MAYSPIVYLDVRGCVWDLDGTLYKITEEMRERVKRQIHEIVMKEYKWTEEQCTAELRVRNEKFQSGTLALMSLGFPRNTVQKAQAEAKILDLLQYDGRLVAMFGCLRGLRHFIETDSSRELAFEKIKRIGLDPSIFEYILTTDDMAHPKPDEEWFRKPVRYSSLPSSRLAWIDDRSDHILVAKELGYRTVLVREDKHDDFEPDLWVPEVYDVEKYLVGAR